MTFSGAINFIKKALEDLIEFFGLFHHRCMTAFLQKNKLRVRQHPVKILSNMWWRHIIFPSPDEQHRQFDLRKQVGDISILRPF